MTRLTSADVPFIADAIRDPGAREAMQQASPILSVAAADQWRAAVRDASTIARALTDKLKTNTPIPHEAIPDWLLLPILDGLVAWQNGKASTCRHSPTPARLSPIVMAAWRPNVVSCPACVPFLFRLRPGSEKDRTCDRCSRVVSGEPGDLMTPCRVTYGAAIYLFGACGDCVPTEFTDHEAVTP